ncbi:MAG TPA: GDSL-type esterase/lipase family protein, partial [Thermoleophilaceae bacterium]|nr:GDSL-type esterase/lipase family protein [Thermoleophilaceae bacterium]
MSLRAVAAGTAVLMCGLLPPSATAAVLVVGDSLGVGTEPSLRAALPDVDIQADSLNGRTSTEGVAVLGGLLEPEHDTVVFDLGTNDGNTAVGVTAGSLTAARELTGERCLVVATLHRPPLAGIPIDAQNDMIRGFAATTPNVALVDWHDAASATPGALRPDGVHATPAGYALRGSLFAEAIRGGCLGGGGGGAPAGPATGGSSASTTGRPAPRRTAPRRGGPPP